MEGVRATQFEFRHPCLYDRITIGSLHEVRKKGLLEMKRKRIMNWTLCLCTGVAM